MQLRFKFNHLQFIRIIYWLFLVYMVAAFIWWYVSLVKQNDLIAQIQYSNIQTKDPAILNKNKAILDFQTRKTKQYIGEGVTFLCLFLF